MPSIEKNCIKMNCLVCSLPFLFVFSLLFLPGCAPPRALIDRSAMDGILWPGPPEKPRIAYQWSVSVLAFSEGSKLYDLFVGISDADLTDPSTALRLLRPYSIFVDDSGKLYITDTGAYRVTIIDTASGLSRNIVHAGAEEFLSPIGVVVYQEKIYVSDSLKKQVFVFDREGKQTGKLEGEFERPTSLALDRNSGVLYVCDTLAHTIYLYTPEGKRRGSIGRYGTGEAEFNFPTHLWVDRKGNLYVTDSMNSRIQIFSPDGKFAGMFGMLGDSYGNLEKPKGVASDSHGNIYVVDSIKDTVKIFSGEGKLLLFFGQQGRDYGQFWLPSGIFIDEKDYIYVADTYNGRVQVFKYLGNK